VPPTPAADRSPPMTSFAQTRNNALWKPGTVGVESYSDMVSVTILPTFYSLVLNLSGELVFKLVYPLLFSIVPLVLFCAYRRRFGDSRAILGVFLFISFATFYIQMAYLARQMIAELFFVLLILLFSETNRKFNVKETIILLFLTFGLVVSHYALTYFFLLFSLAYLLMALVIRKTHEVPFNPLYLVLSTVLSFGWYIYVSTSKPFLLLVSNIGRIITSGLSLSHTIDPSVLKAIGLLSTGSFWHEVGRFAFYAANFLILLGVLKITVQIKKKNLDTFFFSGIITSMVLILLSVFAPFFAYALDATRLYHITLLFLAPTFAIGGETLSSFLLHASR
jgi:uncharacterized membrane protein